MKKRAAAIQKALGQRFLELAAGFERGHDSRFYLNCFARGGIAAFTGFAPFYVERTETDERHFLAALHGFGYGIQDYVNDRSSFLLGEAALF